MLPEFRPSEARERTSARRELCCVMSPMYLLMLGLLPFSAAAEFVSVSGGSLSYGGKPLFLSGANQACV